jgi:hypothetical protein
VAIIGSIYVEGALILVVNSCTAERGVYLVPRVPAAVVTLF